MVYHRRKRRRSDGIDPMMRRKGVNDGAKISLNCFFSCIPALELRSAGGPLALLSERIALLDCPDSFHYRLRRGSSHRRFGISLVHFLFFPPSCVFLLLFIYSMCFALPTVRVSKSTSSSLLLRT